jgi:phosphate transport system substrate-binding protein
MIWGKDSKKIKIIAIVAGVILFVGILSGCIGGDNQDTQTLIIGGSTTVFPITQAAADAYMDANQNVDIQVSGTGSSNGISSVGGGSIDIGMASRELKSTEIDTYPNLVQHVVAKDGIALIIHTTNTVEQLSTQQVKDIYLGTYTNWNELGGPNKEIVVVGRDSASGTREFFYDHVMGKEEFVSTMLEENSNGAVHATVSTTPGAIGYVGLGYVDNEVSAINILNEDTDTYIEPTVQNVLDGKYPIFRNLNMFTNGEPSGLAKEFIDYIQSEEGQQIVENEGFVPI